MNLILFLVAWILIPPLTVWNLIVVNKKYGNTKGYFRSTALSIDIWGNREFRTLWNSRLIIEGGYQFGREGETISSALGKNKLMGTLTKEGNKLANILDKIDTNHCIKSMKYFDDAEKEKFEMLKSA
jgi:hypothetical protein